MDRAQQRRLALRELGRRRVGRVTWAVAVAGTALAAVFGVAFAKGAAGAQTVSPPASPGAPGADGGDDGQLSPDAPPSTELQPPYEAPRQRHGGGFGARSSPTQ